MSNHLDNVLSVVSDRPIGMDFRYYIQDMVSGTYKYSPVANEYYYVGSGGTYIPTIGTDNSYDYYLADVVSVSDYYPFGMVIEGRSGTAGSLYRYGFNRQEGELEITGSRSHTSAEYWMYDSRLGRRWNIDPIIQIPLSGYVVNRNNPINFFDPNGDSPNDSNQKQEINEGKNDKLLKREEKFNKKFDKKYEKFHSQNPNASKTDFIYYNVNKKWYKSYEESRISRISHRSVGVKTIVNNTPDIAFVSTQSAGVNNGQINLNLGMNSGFLTLDMDAYSAKDRFQILDPINNTILFDSRYISNEKTSGEIKFTLNNGGTNVIVLVTQKRNAGESKWVFTLSADPNSEIRSRMLQTIENSNFGFSDK